MQNQVLYNKKDRTAGTDYCAGPDKTNYAGCGMLPGVRTTL